LINQILLSFSKLTEVAGPHIILWPLHHPRPYRIQVNITDQFQEIGILITHDCLVPPLKKMPHLPISPVKILRISKQKGLHDLAQRDLFDLHKKVNVVFHQCVGIETKRKSHLTMGKVGKEPLQVLLIPKYPLPAVPSADHMVKSAGKMYPRSTSHTGNISK